MQSRLLAAKGLTVEQLLEISELDKRCCEDFPLNMKLNWDVLNTRSRDEINDFLYYDHDTLVGFLGLYGFGTKPQEIEITGMVHPGYRRRGIFSQLVAEAQQECIRREAGRILWVCERSSESALGFVKSIGASYDFSEYRLRFAAKELPAFPRHGIELRRAVEADYPALKHIDQICFGDNDSGPDGCLPLDIYESSYVALHEGKVIGKVRTTLEQDEGGIYGFCVFPEYRRRGYGREILSRTMEILLKNQAKRIFLEVAVQNEGALALYLSCGFKQLTVYDYYAYPLR